MEYRGNGGPPPGQAPTLGEMLERFPGPIAVLAGPITNARRTVSYMANDHEPWSIDVGYTTSQGHLLTIRTVRSREGLNPYGLPVEDLATAVINAANRELATNPSRAAAREEGAEAWALRHVMDSRLLRAETAATPAYEVSLTMDGATIPGTRVDVSGWAAVELQWGAQRVFAAGRPDIIDDLALRSARAGELST